MLLAVLAYCYSCLVGSAATSLRSLVVYADLSQHATVLTIVQPLMLAGMACALLSGAMFMLLATYFAMPVSTTHAIVGAVLGMTVAGAGAACIRWGYPGLLTIVASWFASPVLAGLLSATMHLALQRGVFKVLPNSTSVSVRCASHDNAAMLTHHHQQRFTTGQYLCCSAR